MDGAYRPARPEPNLWAMRSSWLCVPLLLGALAPSGVLAQAGAADGPPAACDLSAVPGVVWWGPAEELTLEDLATNMAPVFWFSPDEPLLEGRAGADIPIPQPLPFEASAGRPVVYYQLEELLVSEETTPPAYSAAEDKGQSRLALGRVRGVNLTYYLYFASEEGLASHHHDVEPVAFRAVVLSSADEVVQEYAKGRCAEPQHLVVVTRVTGMAHGLYWYWNVAETDRFSRFPMFVLVEEGKHALATDRNGDGYFTPGFDVTRHPNDAWGVRDVARTGTLFSASYEGWMTKVRRPEHRVFPPVPWNSPMRRVLAGRGAYERPFTEYELRPLPPLSAVTDPSLVPFLKRKVVPDWPKISESTPARDLAGFVAEGNSFGSLSIGLRADGDLGLFFAFPLLLVRNVEEPLTGGFLVWRLYLKDHRLRDLGLTALYTTSASRWVDSYLSAGAEFDREPKPDGSGDLKLSTDFVLELGIKFRFNIESSPLRFLRFLTSFWGVRFGIKNTGFFDVSRLGYVIEVGAGAW